MYKIDASEVLVNSVLFNFVANETNSGYRQTMLSYSLFLNRHNFYATPHHHPPLHEGGKIMQVSPANLLKANCGVKVPGSPFSLLMINLLF